MKVLVKHFGHVKGGQTIFLNQRLYKSQLDGLEGCEFELTIKKRTRKPTVDQGAYYRGGILGTCHDSEMFSHFENADMIHDEYFSPLFLSYKKLVTVGSKTLEITNIRSMADLDREETSKFIERVIAHCESELGIHILTPEEYYSKHYNITT